MPKSTVASDQPVRLRDLCAQYEQDWLLVKILDTTAPPGDEPCILLARGDRAAMFKAAKKALKQLPKAPVAIVGGGTKFGTLDPLRQAIARIVAGKEEPVSISLG